MALQERPSGRVVVVDVSGPLDRHSGATVEPAAAVKRLIATDYKLILLNVAGLAMVDSMGLGAITQSYTPATRAGVAFKLLNATDRMRELLALTHLDRFFELAVFEDAELVG